MPEAYAHYEDYPYPDAEVMARKSPMSEWRTEYGPTKRNWEQWFPGEQYGQEPKRVLVVGCGTTEAVIVAQQEPQLDVTGVDQSEASIKIARENAKGIDNLLLINSDVTKYTAPPFDAVICSGVLHHIRDELGFVKHLRTLTRDGGPLLIMVYGDKERGFVPSFADMLRTLGAEPDALGIEFTRYLLGKLPVNHPARMFTARTDNTDAQIADLWLHRYFRQYSAPELFDLMEAGRFRYRQWMNTAAVSTQPLEDLPSRFSKFGEAFNALPMDVQFEIGQIIGHADHKLTVMFEAA